MKEIFFSRIEECFNKKDIKLTEEQKEKFFTYYNLLLEWNNKFNLTAITSMEDVIYKHFFDSVLGEKYIKQNAKIIDIGAGAGFPSIPLKILRPDIQIVMLDSVNKKITFLQEVIKVLNLENITAIHSRAEDLASKAEYREKFDATVSRAVSRLNTLCEYCLPFIKIGGEMIAYKSIEADVEVEESKKAISILGGKFKKIEDVSFDDFNRNLVFIAKISSTPIKYPRGQNKPRLMPLK